MLELLLAIAFVIIGMFLIVAKKNPRVDINAGTTAQK